MFIRFLRKCYSLTFKVLYGAINHHVENTQAYSEAQTITQAINFQQLTSDGTWYTTQLVLMSEGRHP